MRHPHITCDPFEFIPLTRQAAEFLAGLNAREHAKLLAACRDVAAGFTDGRPHSGRTTLIRASKVRGLFELRITRPRATGPQLRLLCMRDRNRVLIARGFVKRSRGIPRSEVELAEKALARYTESGDERGGKGRGG